MVKLTKAQKEAEHTLDLIDSLLKGVNDDVIDLQLLNITCIEIGNRISDKHKDHLNIDYTLVNAYLLTHYQLTKERIQNFKRVTNGLRDINSIIFGDDVIKRSGKIIKELGDNIKKLSGYMEDGSECQEELIAESQLLEIVIKDRKL